MFGSATKMKVTIGLGVLALLHFGINNSSELLFLFILTFILTLVFLPMFQQLSRITNILLLIGITLLLVFCFVTIRSSSFDGLVTYLKIMYLVKSNFSEVFSLSNPVRPFFIELFLGLLWRYFDIRIVGLAIGVAYLVVGYLTLNFLSLLGYSKKVCILALTALLGSPTFLLFGLYEYKIELFFLVSCLITYIVFYKVVAGEFTARKLFLFGLLSGFTLLIKFTYLPLFVCLGLCITYEILVYQKFRFIKKMLLLSFLVVLGFSPGLIWTAIFGSHLSYLGYISKDFEFYRTPNSVLSVDTHVYKYCRAEVIAVDHNQYLPNRNLTDVLIQPVNYLLNRTVHNTNHYAMFDIGFILYMSLVAFVPLVILHFKAYSRAQKYIYLSAIVYIVVFFLTVGATMWYLVPVLPVVAAPLLAYLYDKGTKNSIRLLDSLIVAIALIYFILVLLVTIKANSLSTEMYFARLNIQEFSAEIESATLTGLVYNKSTFGFDTFNRNQHHVLPNTYFFAGNATAEERYQELVSKGVTHISILPVFLDSSSELPCAANENRNFELFEEKYLIPVYFYEDRPILWRIKYGGGRGVRTPVPVS